MHIYDKFFSEYNKIVAQILFNAEDIEDVKRRENLTNTLNTLLKNGILPIINENDSVSYAEIESDKKVFGRQRYIICNRCRFLRSIQINPPLRYRRVI